MDYENMNILDVAAELHHYYGSELSKTITRIRNLRGWLFGWKPPCPPYTAIAHPYSYKELRENN